MAKKGRPSKYSHEVVNRLTQAIALGCTYALACDIAGISEDTFARWRLTKPEFADAIAKARGERALRSMMRIEKSADAGNWHADKWILERLYPEDYGRTIQDINANISGEITTLLVRRSDE